MKKVSQGKKLVIRVKEAEFLLENIECNVSKATKLLRKFCLSKEENFIMEKIEDIHESIIYDILHYKLLYHDKKIT